MRCAGISAQQKAEILGQIKFGSGKEKKYDFGISCKSSKFFKTFFQLNTTLQFTWGFKKQLYHKEDLSFWKKIDLVISSWLQCIKIAEAHVKHSFHFKKIWNSKLQDASASFSKTSIITKARCKHTHTPLRKN